MRIWLPACMAWFILVAEVVVTRVRRPGKGFTVKDRHSYLATWIVNPVVITLAFFSVPMFPNARMPMAGVLFPVGLVFFVGGLILRGYSIFYLGRFFTVKVAIAEDHRLVDMGPYRWLRHPSYAGLLAAFLGVTLCLGNGLSLLLIMGPLLAVFSFRIWEEEKALTEALGEEYRIYMRRTWRLIPLVY